MTFKPSENEERYFTQLEIERRRAAEERRRRGSSVSPEAGSSGTGRHSTGSATPDGADGE